MQLRRSTVALVAAIALAVSSAVVIAVPASPAGALEPFPPGDDQVRIFYDLVGPTCTDGGFAVTDVVVRYENIPDAEVTVERRIYRNGRLVESTGAYPVTVVGSTDDHLGGRAFTVGAVHPWSQAMLTRVVVDGEPTYLGGAVVSCTGPGEPPAEAEYERFALECGVEGLRPFPDVPADDGFCDDVAWARDWHITEGYADGRFHPTDPVSRQAMAAFLFRASDATVLFLCLGDPFPDVLASNPFCAHISWLFGQGIADGYADGTFRPAAPVSRQAMAAFLFRFTDPGGLPPVCMTDAFPDVPQTHPFCGEIKWLAATGISTGYADGTFRPAAPVSRQAMAAFLHRQAVR